MDSVDACSKFNIVYNVANRAECMSWVDSITILNLYLVCAFYRKEIPGKFLVSLAQ